jgi:hypothetical protein
MEHIRPRLKSDADSVEPRIGGHPPINRIVKAGQICAAKVGAGSWPGPQSNDEDTIPTK